jgi:hypothetical protein
MDKSTNTPPALHDQLLDLKTSAEQAKVKLTPEIKQMLLEGAEKVEAKVLAHEKLTKADLAFIGEARRLFEFERFRQVELPPQFAERLVTLSFFGFLDVKGATKKGDVPAPTLDQAMAVFTPDMLALVRTFQAPTLLLVPDTSFDAKVKAIDARKNKGQAYTYQAGLYKKSDSGSEKITGWRAVIVDGAKGIDPKKMSDDVELALAERVENRKAARKPGEKGMGRHAYALLMMESLRKGEPIDKNTWTLLDDDPALSDTVVPCAYWDGARVSFDSDLPDVALGFARLRSAVGGVVSL